MEPDRSVRSPTRAWPRGWPRSRPGWMLRPLPPGVVQRLVDDMCVLLTYHSNAIEGNTLTLYETKIVIEEGVTISGQPLRYYPRRATTPRRIDLTPKVAEQGDNHHGELQLTGGSFRTATEQASLIGREGNLTIFTVAADLCAALEAFLCLAEVIKRRLRVPLPSCRRTSRLRRRPMTTSAPATTPSTTASWPGRNAPIGTMRVRSW